jgi:hypothetical protein
MTETVCTRKARRVPRPVRLLLPVVAGALALAGLAAGTAGTAGAATSSVSVGPDYEMPFPCGDAWNGSSRSYHSPSPLSIDWNRENDLGAMVVAAAPGVVTSVVDLGNRSYGRYIVVDHGNGRSTLYAHLSAFWSTPGEAVDQGTPLGLVGSSGGSTGPHLHFEERLNRVDHRSWFHRTLFTMGSTQASQNCGDAPVVGDWDGNGRTNLGIQHRTTAPSFQLKRPGHPPLTIPFGWRTDQALSGDWDGDGTIDIGVRRPSLQLFVLRGSSGRTATLTLGRVSDVGIAGDWDGDGRTDVGVWHPSTRVFTLRRADGSTSTVTFGSLGDRPVAGDWNGDGRADLGVWSSSTSTFTLRTVARSGAVSYAKVRWGNPRDLPVAGDWNGDGVDDVGVWDPVTAKYWLRDTPTGTQRTALTRATVWGTPRG